MAGAQAGPTLEGPGKVGRIGIAKGIGNLAQVHARVFQKFLGPLKANLIHQLLEAGLFFLKAAFQGALGHKQSSGYPRQFWRKRMTGLDDPSNPAGKAGIFLQLFEGFFALRP